jgi:hypothetical protein
MARTKSKKIGNANPLTSESDNKPYLDLAGLAKSVIRNDLKTATPLYLLLLHIRNHHDPLTEAHANDMMRMLFSYTAYAEKSQELFDRKMLSAVSEDERSDDNAEN